MSLGSIDLIIILAIIIWMGALSWLIVRFINRINAAFQSLQLSADRRLVYFDELENGVNTVWRALAVAAATALHSPHIDLARRDELLEAFINESITEAQIIELVSMLDIIITNKLSTSGDKMAATVMLKYLTTVDRVYRTS